MSEVRIFRIRGQITHPSMKTSFTKEVRALKLQDALERVYSELGSRHKLKRYHIKIVEVREIPPEEVADPVLKRLLELE